MTKGFISIEGKYRLLTSPVKINAQNCIDITFSSVFVSESIDWLTVWESIDICSIN